MTSGLRPPPVHAPRRLDSTEDLRQFQRLMTHALVRPLGPGDLTPRRWLDGRSTAEVAEEFIRPNDRLSALERLQIYHRVYWFRLIGAAADDSPGLISLLGRPRFDRLIRAYLAQHPSRSFTLRNLCSRLTEFIATERHWTAPDTAAAVAVATFEWAQTVAFDGPARPPVSVATLRRTPPERLTLDVQPYLVLLNSAFAVDEFVLAVKRREALRSAASQTSESRRRGRPRVGPRPRLVRRRTYLAVHRHENRLYYKRLELAQFRILSALREGRPLGAAVAAGGRRVRPAQAQEWFATWMKLGWLCARKTARGRK